MRRVEQKIGPMFALVLAACSAVVDFRPTFRREDQDNGQASDAGLDGAAGRDGGRDGAFSAPGDDGSTTPPAAGCELASHAGCGAAQLCCDRGDGAEPVCVDTLGARECTACGQPCTDPAAPNCGAGRRCECELGTGEACSAGGRCLGQGAEARCAECETDDDCSAREGRRQCVANQCVQCDRGALRDEASDDEGCNEAARPICDERNSCVACAASPDNCPGDQVCNGTLGCFGCSLLTPLDTRNCGGTRPICRQSSNGQPQCDGCENDGECGSGFCDSRPTVGTGACTNACAPAAPLGQNNCAAPTPFCRQLAGNEFACRPCNAADCFGSPATPFCATDGAQRGSCVACRNNADCAASPSTPICEPAMARCRARQASDCPAGTTFDAATMTCLECVTDADCADTPATPICSPGRDCVSCNMLPSTSEGDRWCTQNGAGLACVTRGQRAGQCAACDPRREDATCPQGTPDCAAVNNGLYACHECDPNDDENTCGGGRDCIRSGNIYVCESDEPPPPPDAGPPTPDGAVL